MWSDFSLWCTNCKQVFNNKGNEHESKPNYRFSLITIGVIRYYNWSQSKGVDKNPTITLLVGREVTIQSRPSFKTGGGRIRNRDSSSVSDSGPSRDTPFRSFQWTDLLESWNSPPSGTLSSFLLREEVQVTGVSSGPGSHLCTFICPLHCRGRVVKGVE